MNFFDIKKVGGNWLSTEDKRLYEKQIEITGGRVGYTTEETAPSQFINQKECEEVDQLLFLK